MLLYDLLNHTQRILSGYPHVVGVGFGWKEICGVVTEIPALRVYVQEKISCLELYNAEIIPQEIGGIPTDVLLAKTGEYISGKGSAHHSRLAVGVAISNLKGVLDQADTKAGGSGLGTLGFFAAVNGTTAQLDVVLVSNCHVLLAHGAQKGDHLYQPAFTYNDGRYIFHRDDLNPIAEIMDVGMEGNYRYSYPNELPKDYFIDCATARLFNDRNVQAQTKFTVSGITGESLIKGAARVHAIDVFAGRQVRVYKLGQTTGLTVGRVVDVAAPAMSSNKEWRENNLLIRLEPQNGEPCFAEDGDSGAVILDERNRAVGLLWGKNPQNPSEAFACHIHPVLDRLNVTLLTYDPFLHFRYTYAHPANRFAQSSQSSYLNGGSP